MGITTDDIVAIIREAELGMCVDRDAEGTIVAAYETAQRDGHERVPRTSFYTRLVGHGAEPVRQVLNVTHRERGVRRPAGPTHLAFTTYWERASSNPALARFIELLRRHHPPAIVTGVPDPPR